MARAPRPPWQDERTHRADHLEQGFSPATVPPARADRPGCSVPGLLAKEFAVSRDTVQRAIRELADEGWIESRRGSGSPEVTLDVYTLTSESLDAHIRVQAERIRGGRVAPHSIAVRMLLPSESLSMPYPKALG